MIMEPFFALCILVSVQRVPRKLLVAVLALGGQLRDGILHGEIPRRRRLRDLHAAIRAGGGLVAEARVRQQVRETTSAHQMPIETLKQFLQFSINTQLAHTHSLKQ